MALPEPHWSRINHAPGIAARISVNDVPFYRRIVPHHQSSQGPFNHMLLSGENHVTMELAEPNANPLVVHTFELLVMRESDDAVIFGAKWPDFGSEYPVEERRLPIVHRRMFMFDEPSPKPIWLDAPRGAFARSSASELHAPVRALHEAYASKDIDAFLEALELKTAEFQKFYGHNPDLAPDAARARYGTQLREGWDLDPYDPEEIVFESWADGRVAYATRRDGRPALFARHKTEPNKAWAANLLLTEVDGAWRIFW